MLTEPQTYSTIDVPPIEERIDYVSRDTRTEEEQKNFDDTRDPSFIDGPSSIQLKPGDILLMEDRPYTDELELSHIAIKIVQFLTSGPAAFSSRSDMVHAVIWSQQTGKSATSLEPEIVEASGKGYLREGHLRFGKYHVWRCSVKQKEGANEAEIAQWKVEENKRKNWADWAAQVGMVWSDGNNLTGVCT